MDSFTTHTGRGVPLRRSNVDTDQIIPAEFLVAGTEFGVGSSRFRGESLENGFLTVLVGQHMIEPLWKLIENDPTIEITVDLENLEIHYQGETISFELDEAIRQRLLEGADDITSTLHEVDAIDEYEAAMPSFKPSTLAV